MPIITRQAQPPNTWRIISDTNLPIGRMWHDAHSSRFLRDGDLAETIQLVLDDFPAARGDETPEQLATAAQNRRTAAREALAQWESAGGRVVDLSAMVASQLNDAGTTDGNTHLYVAGSEIGYFHGDVPQRVSRALRCVRLAEEMWAAEQLSTQNARNTALDAALNRFRDDGGLALQ